MMAAAPSVAAPRRAARWLCTRRSRREAQKNIPAAAGGTKKKGGAGRGRTRGPGAYGVNGGRDVGARQLQGNRPKTERAKGIHPRGHDSIVQYQLGAQHSASRAVKRSGSERERES